MFSSLAQARAEMHSPLSSSPTNEKWWSVGSNNQKWACLVCTYDNWQKTNKCIMCNTSKGSSLPPIIGTAGGATSYIDNYHQQHYNQNMSSNDTINELSTAMASGMRIDRRQSSGKSDSNQQEQPPPSQPPNDHQSRSSPHSDS